MPAKKPAFDHKKPLANVRHEAFVQGMLKGLKAHEAYRAAGFKASTDNTGYVQSWKLLRNAKVSDRLAYLESKAADESVLTKAWLIRQARIVYMKALADSQYAAANTSLKMLGLERATFIPKAEVGRPGDFSEMSDDELRRFISDQTGELGLGEEGEAVTGGSKTPRSAVH